MRASLGFLSLGLRIGYFSHLKFVQTPVSVFDTDQNRFWG